MLGSSSSSSSSSSSTFVDHLLLQEEGYSVETDLGKKMNRFEEFLRCPSCCEFFDNPMSLNCGHVYCSECIRVHLDSVINKMETSSRCPQCPQAAEVSHLRPALTITNLLESYLLVRKDLVVNIEEGILPNEHKTDDEDGVEFVVHHPITNQNTGNSKPKKKVVPSISHMTHKVFHGISLAKAKQLVQELSSRSQVKLKLNGDKDALARRYRDFVNLNNAQLGKQYPKTIEKMCQEINKREMAREKEAIKSKQQNVEKKIEALRNGESNSVFEELTKKIKLQKKINDENRKNRRIPEDMEHSCWAGYRVVYSKVAQRPFYYHIETGAGTWDMPNELTKEPVRDMTSQSQGSCEQNDNNYDADVTTTPMPSNSNGNKGSTRSSTRKRKQLQSQNLHPSQNDNLNLGHDDKEEESGVVLSLSATSDVGPTTTATATTTESKLDMMATSIDTYAPTNKDELLLVNSTAMTQSQKANNPNREASASSSSGTQSHFTEYHPHENEKSWTCGTCTYVNESFHRVCEMCESEGPARKSSRRSSQGAATGTTQTSQTLLSGDAPNNNAFDHMTFASATRRPSNSGRGSSSITVGIQQTGGRKSSGGSGTSRRNS